MFNCIRLGSGLTVANGTASSVLCACAGGGSVIGILFFCWAGFVVFSVFVSMSSSIYIISNKHIAFIINIVFIIMKLKSI